jgi:uncharacterized membrane protein YcaP (DUF421 family)
MFELTTPVWELVARGSIMFVLVLGLMRLVGKRQLGQVTPFDLTVLMLISEAASDALRADDSSITAAGIVIGTMLLLNLGIGFLSTRWKAFDKVMEGEPAILISKGTVDYEKLFELQVTRNELLAALREQGCVSPKEVDLAVLETNGKISVRKRDG